MALQSYVNAASRRRKLEKFWTTDCRGSLPGTIRNLPDDVLLNIFKFYVNEVYTRTEEWQTLVHVCQRWRYVVFASPHCLDLELLCTSSSRVKEMLDIWPPLPIDIRLGIKQNWLWDRESSMWGTDNIIAALERERSDRVLRMNLHVPSQLTERFFAATQYQFPALTDLKLWFFGDWGEELIPDSFLGGSVPHLRTCQLNRVAFPALPHLLLSAHDLVQLSLICIPDPGYISPEDMVIVLSSLISLELLDFWYRSPLPRPTSRESRQQAPMTRTVLPALTSFSFRGVSEYVEDFVAQIDAPRLNAVHITFFNQLIFDIPQLTHFINRIEELNVLYRADVTFDMASIRVALSPERGKFPPARLVLEVSCKEVDWQLSALVQLCSLPLLPMSTLECLRINYTRLRGLDDIDYGQLLELLHPFTTVKNLYLNEGVGPRVVIALQGLAGERVTQVLPALQSIFIIVEELQPSESTAWKAIEPFVVARQRFGHPVAVLPWEIIRSMEIPVPINSEQMKFGVESLGDVTDSDVDDDDW